MSIVEGGIHIEPAKARTVIRLPAAFAAAWSPGFDLHVTGEGATPDEAREQLQRNLRQLGEQLLDAANRI